ncbi:DUF2637 domain-containing protein [Polymorphospora rubra]|uniref:DUF2637 domain-containing protein n=1 Tax=Polymorphospora rubra TaxID=338584 RepID=A0A810MQ35_9ACTN|nr:DUF2637 domain-containing protein [Polymorphospora rubra]BCJ63002.1 hypothetical protein Prubr_00230 [Polymorphospora rubra]
MTAKQLRWMQWAVRATLALGVAASVTANILHAQPNPVSQSIAAWPPLALLITVELVTRVPVHRRSLGIIRIAAASAIAAIAAWISYHHMVGVVARYGETGTVPYLLPLSVDGLIIVASVSLVELTARRRELERQPRPAPPEEPPSTAPTESATPTSARSSGDHRATTPTDRTILRQRQPTDTALDSPRGEDASIDGKHTPAHHESGGVRSHNPDAEPHDVPDSTDESDIDLALGLPADLIPLMPAARTARDQLTPEGQTVSRDALARRLRHNGHSIRNSGVSELLAAIRQEEQPVNGSHPARPV